MTAPDTSLAAQGEDAFSSALAGLSDEELAQPSLLPGWDRATLVAHVACNANAFTRAISDAASGGEGRMYASRAARDAEIAETAALSPAALRDLSQRASSALASVWSGLTEEAWAGTFLNGQGHPTPLRGTVKGRTREIWVHLVDLNAGPGFETVPSAITESVLREVWDSWVSRGADADLAIATTAADGASLTLGAAEDPGVALVSGPLAEVTAWATGRAASAPSATRNGNAVTVGKAPDWA